MSSASTPQPSSGYASPALTPSSSSSKPNSSKLPKPTNVFTNDGSFLERFQRTKKARLTIASFWSPRSNWIRALQEEDEKKKQDDDLARFLFLFAHSQTFLRSDDGPCSPTGNENLTTVL
jgi:hypothetical protein